MLEKGVQQRIQLALGSRANVRLFRNNVGVAYSGQEIREHAVLRVLKNILANVQRFVVLINPRMIKYGLIAGSGDLIGWKTIEITPDMVGKKLAVFLSVETKSEKGRARPDQILWAQNVRAAGGIAGIVRSIDEAEALVDGGLFG